MLRKYGFPEIMRGPETESGAAEPAVGGGLPPGMEGGHEEVVERHRDPLDAERSTARRSIREDLQDQFSAARKAEPEERGKGGRFAAQGARGRGEGAGAPEPSIPQGTTAPAATDGGTVLSAEPASPAEAIKPPSSLRKTELADWDKAPDTIKKAMLRREEEMARGVEELKGRYAEFDHALAPHVDAIKRHGHTPAAAVSQLFAWFQALATNPKVAFPVLAQSFGYDINDFSTRQAAAAQVAQAGGAAPAAPAAPEAGAAPAQPQYALPPEYIQLLDGTWQKIGTLEQQLNQFRAMQAADSQAKTQTIIENWAKDKPHFEDVRVLMSKLIESGVVPLKDGQVDLDGAYDAAIYASRDVRAKIQADEQAKAAAALKSKADAERAAQQAAADRARGASRSLAPSAPGSAGPASAASKQKKGASVKESIMAAIAESRA